MAKQQIWEPKRANVEYGPRQEGNGLAIVGVIVVALILLGQCAG